MKTIYCKKCKEDVDVIGSERVITKYSKFSIGDGEYDEMKELEEEMSDKYYCLDCKTYFNEEETKKIDNMF